MGKTFSKFMVRLPQNGLAVNTKSAVLILVILVGRARRARRFGQ